MKKILFSFMLLAGIFAVIGGMNALDEIKGIGDTEKIKQNISTNYSAKYKDCISQESFPQSFHFPVDLPDSNRDWNTLKVDASLNRYGQTLDSTIRNLNSIDAHNFIHEEFQRSKDIFESKDISDIRKYYHCEIMRMCYDSDRFLNLGSASQL
ncbi:hypothetical protein [Flagellimonas pelagia]|uniref:Uncharacterized protein n=1 Tax=Flagellimonas pelagia TaxID=2306998 RepID=A0A3A1NQH1_9FLAO|nr:hypothetical protein [Allomuricauda maritima]RIV46838.1 hypothetical protein D2V05_02435 [Allomuricauda maritima]TXJ99725.1 hypothetical protein FQ017_02425 [Allomuricauda maritima]